MFSEPYRNGKHFGIWSEESAERLGQLDALRVLDDVCNRCIDDDMRTAYTFALLDYLAARATRPSAFLQFRKALDIHDPEERSQQLQAVLVAIRRVLSA